jgi:hypothetical protein
LYFFMKTFNLNMQSETTIIIWVYDIYGLMWNQKFICVQIEWAVLKPSQR